MKILGKAERCDLCDRYYRDPDAAGERNLHRAIDRFAHSQTARPVITYRLCVN